MARIQHTSNSQRKIPHEVPPCTAQFANLFPSTHPPPTQNWGHLPLPGRNPSGSEPAFYRVENPTASRINCLPSIISASDLPCLAVSRGPLGSVHTPGGSCRWAPQQAP
ncbi:unnamed protein product [Ostreobium quekettii]|uniref:Uncharacterized protein n=1 Tax=Ostreobium quekettii TaxID=121088 RepID=A0A8S1JDH0_9CHLO|nr:unnamed protein product [Ostreobium quekettii]